MLAACAGGNGRLAPGADPPASVAPRPDYTQVCAPSGFDASTACQQVALAAVDRARAREGLGPLALPATFPHLTVAEQLFVVIDGERVDRGLAPFVGMSAPLDQDAARGADRADDPSDPGEGFSATDGEWIGGSVNGLDIDYQWMYQDGPGSGLADCRASGGSGCWADRHIVLNRRAGQGFLVMGVASNARADQSVGDVGGPSVAAVLTRSFAPGPLDYTWAAALAATRDGTLRPRASYPAHTSATGIPDPPSNVAPVPDFTQVCAQAGLDTSAPCTDATLEAINAARSREGVRPMVLPASYRSLSLPQQLLVVVDRERVDRGLAPFTGLTPALDANAQRGADTANDPPDAGAAYGVTDGEWAGGSANVLDADYGWMYNDGYGVGNLDCPKPNARGCWGHREGILDNFGTVGTLVMGAAVNLRGDNNQGDKGGTSIAATLAVTAQPPGRYVYTYGEASSSSGAGRETLGR